MKDMEFKLSEGVTRDICKEIISQIPYESTLKSLRLSRDKKVKDQCISFLNETVENIRQINFVSHENKIKIQDVEFKHPVVKRLGSRLSIVRKKKQQSTQNLPRNKTKNSLCQSTVSKRDGLIKLGSSENEDLEYENFIQLLRKRKEKYNEAMEEFQKKEEELKKMKNKSSQTCVTNFEGKIIKVDRRQKRETAHSSQRSKIKPIVTLRQPLNEGITQRKGSIKLSQQDIEFLKIYPKHRISKNLGSNSNFRSIINIIESKKCMDMLKKSRRMK